MPFARLSTRRPRLDGPYPVLPRPLDALSERWAALPPRVRLAVAGLVVVAMAVAVQVRVQRAEQRWGGAAVPALVAARDLAVGAPPDALRRVQLPPAAVPPGAVTGVPTDAVLAQALPEGAVLTGAHLDPRGPAAGLPPGHRALPVPVQEGWGILAGAWVDVWVLAGETPAHRVATSRNVLEVRTDGSGVTALVGLAQDEVAATSEGLAAGSVLLSHAPAPPANPTLSSSPRPS